jgi:membrane-anchored glycerophosphoryl diester phosphodiesterase (GDPDase)
MGERGVVIMIFYIETRCLFMFPVNVMDSSEDIFSEDLRNAADGKK